MQYEVTGADVSRWQKEIDWSKMLSQGVLFVFIKATEGNKSVDSYFESNMKATEELKIPRGIYHYFKPDKDWKKQADHFSSVVNAWEFELPPVVDFEETDGLKSIENPDGITKSQLNSMFSKFITRFEEQTSKEIMIYTSAGFFNHYMPLTSYAWRKRLWVAHWTNNQSPTLPKEWSNHNKSWSFWQYAKSPTGHDHGVATKAIMLDRYPGSASAFMNEYKIDELPGYTPPPPPPPTQPDGLQFEAAFIDMSIFHLPNATSEIVGEIKYQEVITAEDISGSDEVWIKLADGRGYVLHTYNGMPYMEVVK